jgi:hypothetical protein
MQTDGDDYVQVETPLETAMSEIRRLWAQGEKLNQELQEIKTLLRRP